VAQQTLDFVIAQQVTGQADVARLIKSVGALDAEMQKLRSASASMSGGFNQAANAIRGNTNVLDAQSKALRNQRMGMQQAGMQINDFATSVSTGASPVQAFNQQIGQLGYAMSMMQGRAAAVGRFLAGPWSIAVIGAAMVLGPMISKLFGVEEGAKKTKISLEDLEAITQTRIDSENDIRLALAETATAYRNIQVEVMKTILQKHNLLRVQHAEIQQNLAMAKAERAAIRERNAEMARAAGSGRGAAEAGAMFAATGTGQAVVDAQLQALMESSAALEKTTTKLNASLLGIIQTDKRIAAESRKAAKAITSRGEAELKQAEAIAEKIRDMGLVYGASSKQIGETAKKLDDFNDMVEKLQTLNGGAAIARELAATIAMVRQEIANEGADKALADFNAEVDKLTKKDLTPFEQSIAGLNAALANQELMLDPESGQRYYEGLSAAARPFFNDAIKAQQDLIDKAMGVDNAFQMQVASLQQIIATMQAAGAPTEELQAQLALFISMQDQLKLAEKNAEIKNSFQAVGQAAANAFKGMITGAQSFGDAMKGVIQAVIDELFRLFVVQQIVGMVSKGFSALTGIPIPDQKALGGSVSANTPYIVGERGPELFMPSKSGTVIPTQNTRGMGGGGSTINVSVDARGATSPEMVRQQVQQGILEAAPSIVAAAEQRTISTLRRPRLAGVM
jgi:hypothetical protein